MSDHIPVRQRRLNIYKVTGGKCTRVAGECEARSCRYNLLDNDGNQTTSRGPSREESCAIRVGNQGGEALERIAERMGISRERVRQIENVALRKLKRAVEVLYGISQSDARDAIHAAAQRERTQF